MAVRPIAGGAGVPADSEAACSDPIAIATYPLIILLFDRGRVTFE